MTKQSKEEHCSGTPPGNMSSDVAGRLKGMRSRNRIKAEDHASTMSWRNVSANLEKRKDYVLWFLSVVETEFRQLKHGISIGFRSNSWNSETFQSWTSALFMIDGCCLELTLGWTVLIWGPRLICSYCFNYIITPLK